MRIGVFGQSSIGQRHAKLIRDLGHEVVTCDPVRPAMTIYAADVWDQVNAVVIATPPLTHLALAQEAARRGLPMLIEKPLGVPEQIEAWRKVDGQRLLVGYQWRYAPELQRVCAEPAKEITAEYYGAFGAREAQWLRDPQAGGGVLLEYSHALDYALWAGGDWTPGEVLALLSPGETFAALEWEKTKVFLASEGPPRATLIADGCAWSRLNTDLNACYATQMAHFLDVCRTGVMPRCGLSHGLRVLEIVEKARRSFGEWA